MQPSPGKLVIISGPSGVGKSTVVEDLLARCKLPLALSVSATTRPPRKGEVDGVNYHFLTYDEFQRRHKAGDFLECFEPYGNGVWYGTLRDTVNTGLAAGKWVLLEIEVNGALEVMEKYPQAISVFLLPESQEVLERRLRDRNSEPEEAVLRRLERARYELSLAHHYRHQVINRTGAREQTVKEICDILQQYGDQKA
jgi:guanylate kinase